ncbi:heme exporter protein CcmB [Aureimonas leprariae]|uniref:Heme exporter protein B n=1 Tax=Plantimonas leprariae TaxID=2615207 RepID=A0A7V7PR84_9HYPH|nr:heme exporter protein CcmB [Aureimonas leprariae]KAB0681193.1 heme exporter protein CcmB [Aureimonas leprariae]
MSALFLRDLRLGFANGGAVLGLVFFLAVVAAMPFALGPDMRLLARLGPAILWIGALLASLLTLDRLFQADRDDGTLDLLVAGGRPLFLVVLVKCAAHWCATGLPLALATPFLGLVVGLGLQATVATVLTLLVGTPAITCLGAVGAAVAVALPRGGLLVSVLVLPLALPVLIFGVSAAYGTVSDAAPFAAPLAILGAITLFTGVVGPLAAALALRSAGD